MHRTMNAIPRYPTYARLARSGPIMATATGEPGIEPGASVVTVQYSNAGTGLLRVLVSFVSSSRLVLPARSVTSSST